MVRVTTAGAATGAVVTASGVGLVGAMVIASAGAAATPAGRLALRRVRVTTFVVVPAAGSSAFGPVAPFGALSVLLGSLVAAFGALCGSLEASAAAVAEGAGAGLA